MELKIFHSFYTVDLLNMDESINGERGTIEALVSFSAVMS
jgi:hypothetical protein